MGCTFSKEDEEACSSPSSGRRKRRQEVHSDVGPVASDTNVHMSTKVRSIGFGREDDPPKSSSGLSNLSHQTPGRPNAMARSPSMKDLLVNAMVIDTKGRSDSVGTPVDYTQDSRGRRPTTDSPSLGAMSDPSQTNLPLNHPAIAQLSHGPPSRGSIRVLSRDRDRSVPRDHSHSPTPHHHTDSSMDLPTPGSSSPLRRDISAARFPPNLNLHNLQSRVRLARELDSPEPSGIHDMSPRQSARLSQTANIRNNLARQASLSQQQFTSQLLLSAANLSSPGANTILHSLTSQQQQSVSPPAPVVTVIAPTAQHSPIVPSLIVTEASEPADPADSRRGMHLNPRRHGSTESPTTATRFLAPATSPIAVSMRSSTRHASVSVSQAIDLIDGSANPPHSSRELSPTNRRSHRASRHSLGQQPVPLLTNSNGLESGRRSTRGRGRGRRLALIIDNNVLSRHLTVVALHRIGFTCCDVASEGEAAINMVTNTCYELILIDSHLPTMSAVETVSAIRWLEEKRGDSPTVVLAHTHAVDAASLDSYRIARMSGCIERGCVLVGAVGEAMESLARNPNFIVLLSHGQPKQDERIEQQEAAEAAALQYAEKMAGRERATSRTGISPSREPPPAVAPHEGDTVRSNRRTTSTGRSFPIVTRNPSVDSPGVTVTPPPVHATPSAEAHSSPTHTPTPAPDRFSPQPALVSATAGAAYVVSPSPTPPPILLPHAQTHTPPSPSSPQSNLLPPNVTQQITARTRRASLSIHSLPAKQ